MPTCAIALIASLDFFLLAYSIHSTEHGLFDNMKGFSNFHCSLTSSMSE